MLLFRNHKIDWELHESSSLGVYQYLQNCRINEEFGATVQLYLGYIEAAPMHKLK